MRILVVSDMPSFPPTAGNRERLRALLAHLRAQGWALGLHLLARDDAATWDLVRMRASVEWLTLDTPPPVPFSTRVATAVQRRLRPMAALAAEPLGIDDWCPGWFRDRVEARVRDWRPDVVLVMYVYLSACLEQLAAHGVAPPCTIIDTHDVMHRRAAVYQTAGLPVQWFHANYAEEARGLTRADVLLAIHPDEASILATMAPGCEVLTIPHGHEVLAQPPPMVAVPRILCVASDNDLNVRGLVWFFDAVWPIVLEQQPAAELVICGSVARKLTSIPDRVTLAGIVDDLGAAYASARLAISAVPAGTGLKVKAVEALCHGRPVVATTAGAEGIAPAGDGLVVTDDPRAMAGAILGWLTDDARCAAASAAALAEARRRFRPEIAFAPLVGLLSKVISRSP
jgi:polysaccharide biosynthesis protein PslH